MTSDVGLRLDAKTQNDRRWARASVIVLTVLPAASALSPVRAAGVHPLSDLAPLGTMAVVACVCIALVELLWHRRNPCARRDASFPLVASLILWLALRSATSGELDSARNYLVMLVVLSIVVLANLSAHEIGTALRLGMRLCVFWSIVSYVIATDWYVDEQAFFRDSGKIIPSIPNVQGILSHANYTGLLFSVAIVVELALRRDNKRQLAFHLFVLADIVLLAATQSRNSIIAAIGGSALVLAAGASQRWKRPLLLGSFGFSCIPLGVVVQAMRNGDVPDFSAFSIFGTRQSLWPAVTTAIEASPVFGAGPSFIEPVQSLVADRDVSQVTHAHNQWLQLAGEGGLIAVILGFVFALSIVKQPSPRSGDKQMTQGLVLIFLLNTLSETPVSPYPAKIGTILVIALVAIRTGAQDGHPPLGSSASRPYPTMKGFGKAPDLPAAHKDSSVSNTKVKS